MNKRIPGCFRFALPLTIAGVIAGTGNSVVFAQLTPDNTLGAENSIVTPQQLQDLIQGGAIRGNALFHSFEDFNVNELLDSGQIKSVFFDLQGNADILNILTRVTGSNSSNILGTLGVLRDALNSNALGDANLFLLNPNGITFGENANLQLNGSFFATTADGFGFDNFTFSASGQEAPPPLLTVNIPPFLSFRDNPGNIVNQSVAQEINGETVGLQVQSGETLGLIGGEVQFSGGNAIAPDARIEIGGVGGNGLVSLTETDAGFVLGYEGIEAFENLTFNQSAFVNTSGDSGGSIQLQGRDIRLSDGSLIFADTSGAGTGGGIVVNSEQLILEDRSLLTTDATATATGNAGDLTINTSQLLIQDGAWVSSDTLGEGKGGTLTINATDSVQVIGTSADGQRLSFITADTYSTGDAGNLTINTPQLLIQDGAWVSSDTLGEGDGGGLTVNATDSVQVIGTSADGTNPSRLTAQANSTGNGGDLTINTSRLLVQGGGWISTDTRGEGKGGTLTINATDSVQVIGTSADGQRLSFITADTYSTGDAGNLTINTPQLLIQDGAWVSSDTLGEGDGGGLTVNATDSVQVIGTSADAQFRSFLSSRGISDSTGDAGNLIINTGELLIQGGGWVNTDTFGEGNGGTLTINATDSVQVIGTSADGQFTSFLSADATATATGNAGNLTITASQLLVQDGAQVSAATLGDGNAGNLIIQADQIELVGFTSGGRSGLFASAIGGGTGNGGDLNIVTDQLTIRDGAIISVSNFQSQGQLPPGQGNVGNIEITSDTLILEDGRITADANTTTGGDITLNISDYIFLLNGDGTLDDDGGSLDLISADSQGDEQGDGGNITINTTALLAIPGQDSDITANSEGAQGGTVTINADDVFNIQESGEDLPNRNDITATSALGPQFRGQVIFNTPQTNPKHEVIEEAEVVLDETDVVTQNVCETGYGSQFSNSGRGGVPQIPGFIIRNDVVDVELVDEVPTPTDATKSEIDAELVDEVPPPTDATQPEQDVNLMDGILPAPPPEAIKPHHRTDVTFIDSEGEEYKPAMGAVLLPNGMVEFVDYNPAEVYRDMYRDMYAAPRCPGR